MLLIRAAATDNDNNNNNKLSESWVMDPDPDPESETPAKRVRGVGGIKPQDREDRKLLTRSSVIYIQGGIYTERR